MIEKIFGETEAIRVAGVFQLGQARKDQAEIGERPVAALPVPRGGFEVMEQARGNRFSTQDGEQDEYALAIRIEGQLFFIRHSGQTGAGAQDKSVFIDRD